MQFIIGTLYKKKQKIKATINADTMTKINQYCEWANIDDVGFFIEEAASYVFAKDKEWKDHQRSIRRTEKKS
jgi:hypothetical protein